MSVSKQLLFIANQYHDANESFINYNPATNQALGEIAIADESLIQLAVNEAEKAFHTGSQTSVEQRSDILLQAAALLRAHNDELAHLEVLDTGKPIQEASVVDVCSAADCLEYFAKTIINLKGEHIAGDNHFIYTKREPLGICAGIGAWNYPLQIACWKAAPALACGNTMVYKPSELTPMTSLKLAEIFQQAGLPAGVFNVIQGDAHCAQTLINHPKIAKISLTGSVPTGKKVMAAAAQHLQKVTMELGGKSPFIVFADADLTQAVSGAMLANFYTQGEICSNGTRVFVERSIADDFINALLTRVKRLTIGDPLNPETQIGSLISPQHLEKVLSYIEQGKKEGANLLYGGTPWGQQGNFITPAIFTECQDDMTIAREEIFGPVMSIFTFDNENEVIQRANNTEFGLAAGIFTQNITKAHRVIGQLQAGTCWINNYNITPIIMPFGGYKQSGIGRENGTAAIEHYTQLKSVYVELGEIDCPYP